VDQEKKRVRKYAAGIRGVRGYVFDKYKANVERRVKTLNESFGRKAPPQVITDATSRIESQIKEYDNNMSQYQGGDPNAPQRRGLRRAGAHDNRAALLTRDILDEISNLDKLIARTQSIHEKRTDRLNDLTRFQVLKKEQSTLNKHVKSKLTRSLFRENKGQLEGRLAQVDEEIRKLTDKQKLQGSSPRELKQEITKLTRDNPKTGELLEQLGSLDNALKDIIVENAFVKETQENWNIANDEDVKAQLSTIKETHSPQIPPRLG